MATALAAVIALGSIATFATYLVKAGFWLFTKTPEQKKEAIDADEDAKEKQEQESGRPS